MDIITLVIFLAILGMFVIAGFDKITNHDASVKRLTSKIGGDPSLSSVLIWMTALFEIVAPLVVVWWLITGTGNIAAISAAVSLAIFTVIVTIMFYGAPKASNKWPFWSNVTTTGALLLVASTIYNA